MTVPPFELEERDTVPAPPPALGPEPAPLYGPDMDGRTSFQGLLGEDICTPPPNFWSEDRSQGADERPTEPQAFSPWDYEVF